MSEQDVKSVSAATATLAVLQSATGKSEQSGKSRPEPGKDVPLVAMAELQKLAQDLNVAQTSIGRDLRFEVDVASGKSVIQVLDRETGEIIRQIPPEHAKTYVSGRGDVVLRLYDDLV